MLSINIPNTEMWNEVIGEFVNVKGVTLNLEHSLVSISRWESKWHKPFLGTIEKTYEETIDYIKCMTLNPNVKEEVYLCLTNANLQDINDYIVNPMTATTFSEEKTQGGMQEIVTSELIYYWMIALNVPPEYQKWHINRLLTLIRICNIKSQPPKKMSPDEIRSRNAALNAARRKRLNTKG